MDDAVLAGSSATVIVTNKEVGVMYLEARTVLVSTPAAEVLAMIQCTIFLLGNASELISQTRCAKILEAVNSSWARYCSEEFTSSSNTLFDKECQNTLSKKVEKDTALSKAMSMTRRAKKEDHPSSSKRVEQKKPHYIHGAPPARYGGRQGKSFFPYNSQFVDRQGEHSQARQQIFNHQPRQGQTPICHEPRLPGKTQQKKF